MSRNFNVKSWTLTLSPFQRSRHRAPGPTLANSRGAVRDTFADHMLERLSKEPLHRCQVCVGDPRRTFGGRACRKISQVLEGLHLERSRIADHRLP